VFLLSHFVLNARAIAGREAYGRMVESFDRIPGLWLIETLAIGVPIAVHMALGPILATTRQAALEPPRPNPRLRWIQRATGFYLAMYLCFHLWAVRLAPERLAGRLDLFERMASQLRDPTLFALQALAVIAAAAHFGIGFRQLACPGTLGFGPRARRVARLAGAAGFVVLTLVGLNALLAFVWAPARWLAAP
jgi:succinate dehydrogenase / fumarate reductase cytochrome b subunit